MFATSVAFAVSEYVTRLVLGTAQLQVYGAVESVHLRAPLTKNCTLATPDASEAEAAIATVLPAVTVPPFAGDVIATAGAVRSTRMLTADFAEFPALSTAVAEIEWAPSAVDDELQVAVYGAEATDASRLVPSR